MLELEAKHSIMVYDDNGKTVAVLYDKRDNRWGNARSLSSDDLIALCDSTTELPTALLPPEMLWYVDSKIMVWYAKPHTGKIRIRGKLKTYRHPGIVFCVRRGTFGADKLSIAVVNISDPDYTPKLDDTLYESPYAGIDVHPAMGRMGNCHVVTPNPKYAFSLEYECWLAWQEAFFESQFNNQPKRRNTLITINPSLRTWINAHINTPN